METLLQSLKSRLSFKNATLFLCLFNLITALFLLHAFFSSSSSSSSSPRFPSNHPISVQLRQIQESEEIRRAMQPLELIQRVWEIEHEINAEPETGQHKETKQTAAFDLSKRLSNAHTVSDSASLKALEEWRKRKMERARQREGI